MPADPHDWHSRAFKSAAWWRTEADKWDALADSVNLDEGRALLESATPGPWEVTYETRAIQEVCTIHCVEPMPDGEGGARGWCHIVPPRVIDGKWIWSSQKQQTANAALIVYAVNNLPALLSAVAALERERDEAVKAERERCISAVKSEAAGFLALLSEHHAAKNKPEHLAVLSEFVTELVDLIAASLREPSDG